MDQVNLNDIQIVGELGEGGRGGGGGRSYERRDKWMEN